MLNHSTTKLTVELGELIENGFELFNFEYPSYYKGAEKLAFEQKIIDHYYFRQIGQETPARFRHYLKCKMREIMPYYIQRYESVALMESGIESGEIKPLENYSMIEEGTTEDQSNTTSTGRGETSSTGRGETSSTVRGETSSTGSGQTTMSGNGEVSNSKNNTVKFSNTPQNNIANLDNYLTEATVTTESESSNSSETKTGTQSETNTGTQSETNTGTQSETNTGAHSESNTEETKGNGKHKLTRHGNIGVTTYAQMLEGYRESFINVDMEIIEELNCLFLGVY